MTIQPKRTLLDDPDKIIVGIQTDALPQVEERLGRTLERYCAPNNTRVPERSLYTLVYLTRAENKMIQETQTTDELT